MRLDNTAVDPESESAVLLDWAYASAGAPWIDVAQLAADVVATGHVDGQVAATDRAYRLLQPLPPEASRYVVGLAGMWCFRAAMIPDTALMPNISAWRRARSAALRPLVDRLLADLDPSAPNVPRQAPLGPHRQEEPVSSPQSLTPEEKLADAKKQLSLPRIVVICGSTRFMTEMTEADQREDNGRKDRRQAGFRHEVDARTLVRSGRGRGAEDSTGRSAPSEDPAR